MMVYVPPDAVLEYNDGRHTDMEAETFTNATQELDNCLNQKQPYDISNSPGTVFSRSEAGRRRYQPRVLCNANGCNVIQVKDFDVNNFTRFSL